MKRIDAHPGHFSFTVLARVGCGSDSRVLGTRTEKMEQVPTALSSAVIYERSTRRQFATANYS